MARLVSFGMGGWNGGCTHEPGVAPAPVLAGRVGGGLPRRIQRPMHLEQGKSLGCAKRPGEGSTGPVLAIGLTLRSR